MRDGGKAFLKNGYWMKKRVILVLLALLEIVGIVRAQNVGIKTNLLTDATLSPNLGIEIGLSRKWSLDITGETCLWDVDGHKWKHWLAQPEIRVWLCDRFAGHFFGLHAIGGQYNFGSIHNNIKFLGSDFSQLSRYRFQGWGAGAGIAYGYDWVLGKHWNLEAEIGIGWIHTKFDKYECSDCGRKVGTDLHHNYFGPTKLSLALEYIF